MEANKIIITGGATRIGAAIAKKLAKEGVEIVIHYFKSKSVAEKLKKELTDKKAKIYLVQGDLSKEPDVNKLIKFAKSKLGYFDCLVNNASLFENDKLENFNTDSWGYHLRTNLRTPALLSKEFSKKIHMEVLELPKMELLLVLPSKNLSFSVRSQEFHCLLSKESP